LLATPKKLFTRHLYLKKLKNKIKF